MHKQDDKYPYKLFLAISSSIALDWSQNEFKDNAMIYNPITKCPDVSKIMNICYLFLYYFQYNNLILLVQIAW